MDSVYSPDAWVLLEFTYGTDVVRKVLAGWYGGYGGSDNWRLSSGVTHIEDKGNHFIFYNESGSQYFCGKQAQRFSGLMSSVYNGWMKQIEESAEKDITIKLIENIEV